MCTVRFRTGSIQRNKATAMIDDWQYVEKQMMLDVQIGTEPIQRKYFYVWQCRYCGAREVTTELERPQKQCKCMEGGKDP